MAGGDRERLLSEDELAAGAEKIDKAAAAVVDKADDLGRALAGDIPESNIRESSNPAAQEPDAAMVTICVGFAASVLNGAAERFGWNPMPAADIQVVGYRTARIVSRYVERWFGSSELSDEQVILMTVGIYAATQIAASTARRRQDDQSEGTSATVVGGDRKRQDDISRGNAAPVSVGDLSRPTI